MENKHIPVMIEEVKSYIPANKELNIIDATFGGGGYSKIILEFLPQIALVKRDLQIIIRKYNFIERKYEFLEL